MLSILVNAREVVPKQIDPSRFPYNRKHDPHLTCGYVGNSTETWHVFKTRVQELINQKLLCFTPVTVEASIKKRFEYKDPSIHVQVPPLMVQPAMQCPNQGYRPRMLLTYPGESSSTIVAPQYAYTGAPYIPFGDLYGQTSNQIVNSGLVHSA